MLKMVLTLLLVLHIISKPLLRLENKKNGMNLNYTWYSKDDNSWHVICIFFMLYKRCFIHAVHLIEKKSM